MASQTSSVDETMAGKKPDEPPTSANGKKKMTARRLLRRFFKDGKHVWKPILLIFLNGIYLLFGGTVFLLLEKTEPIQFNISTEISEVLQVLNETRPGLINLHEETEKMAPSDLEKWETVLEKIHERRVKAESPRWTLSHSVFFCTTLLTTIGYGDIAPVTTPGRFFCIIYAFVGIPFNIMFLAVLGKSMADVINRICAEIIRLWTSYLHPNYEWKSLTAETEINAPVWLGLIILGSFLCFCAWIYSISEDWNYWTACYFTFITFTTIGLGDIVPERTETMVFIDTTLLYIGLAVLALTVNLIVANIVHQMKKTREKLPFVDRFEMSSVNTSEPNETNEDNSEEKD